GGRSRLQVAGLDPLCRSAREGFSGSREVNSKCGTACGERFSFEGPAMLANDGHTNTQAEAGTASGTLGGIERIEKTGERVGPNAHAVILDGNGNARGIPSDANLDTA